MPYKRKYARRRGRRPLRRRTRSRRRVRSTRKRRRRALPSYIGGLPYSRSVVGFWPLRKRATLRYVTTVSVDPPAAGINNHRFNLGSVWDPDATGAGHQPQGFDDLAARYMDYTVLGVKWRIRAFTLSSNVSPAYVGWWVSHQEADAFDSVTGFLESRYARGKRILFAADNGFKAMTYMKGGCNNAKFLGLPWFNRKRVGLTGLNQTGNIGTDPERVPWLKLWVCAADVAQNTGEVTFNVELTYDVLFHRQQVDETQD